MEWTLGGVRWPWETEGNCGLEAPSTQSCFQSLWKAPSFVMAAMGKGRLGPCCTPFHLGVTGTWCPNHISLSPLSTDLLSLPILHAAELIACLIAKTNCCDIHCSSALFSGLSSGRWLTQRQGWNYFWVALGTGCFRAMPQQLLLSCRWTKEPASLLQRGRCWLAEVHLLLAWDGVALTDFESIKLYFSGSPFLPFRD